jgi:fatty acid desaturase
MRETDGAARPSDNVPRWQAERDRIHQDTAPVLQWVYRQWWLYAVAALGMLGVGLSAAASGDTAGDFVPVLVLGVLFVAFTIMAFGQRNK